MHPELFRIGPLAIHSYGVMLALSFLIGIYLAVRNGKKRGIKEDEIVNVAFIIIIASIVGSRLFYVLFHIQEFQGRWIYAFWPVQEDGTIGLGGLILLGGFILAFLSAALYMSYKKLNFWKVADSIVPSIAFGIFLTRIGCHLNGCCFGKACGLPWGVSFPLNSPAGSVMGGSHIHPTQLYSSLNGLIIFLVLSWLDRKNYFDGVLTGSFFILYGIARFVVDFFRYYEDQMFLIA
jgi:phosphatidylglycerol:prolipoprotein diacylglycerol transferase